MTSRLKAALQAHRHLRGERVLYDDDGKPAGKMLTIQEPAGHVSLETTQRYMHLSPAAPREDIRALEVEAGGGGVKARGAGNGNPSKNG